MSEMTTLAGEILKEQERCRELLGAYKEIGWAGAFGHAMISEVLQRTEKAVMEGDLQEMVRCYAELKECQ